jgi:hypothetical protein
LLCQYPHSFRNKMLFLRERANFANSNTNNPQNTPNHNKQQATTNTQSHTQHTHLCKQQTANNTHHKRHNHNNHHNNNRYQPITNNNQSQPRQPITTTQATKQPNNQPTHHPTNQHFHILDRRQQCEPQLAAFSTVALAMSWYQTVFVWPPPR